MARCRRARAPAQRCLYRRARPRGRGRRGLVRAPRWGLALAFGARWGDACVDRRCGARRCRSARSCSDTRARNGRRRRRRRGRPGRRRTAHARRAPGILRGGREAGAAEPRAPVLPARDRDAAAAGDPTSALRTRSCAPCSTSPLSRVGRLRSIWARPGLRCRSARSGPAPESRRRHPSSRPRGRSRGARISSRCAVHRAAGRPRSLHHVTAQTAVTCALGNLG